MDKNRAIGRENSIPWRVSSDMKRFKELTSSHAVVMGNKTFDSLKRKPLPNRKNIVLSSQDLKQDGVEFVKSTKDALVLTSDAEKVFIIGGGNVYSQFVDVADALYLSKINTAIENPDAFFPKLSSSWKKTVGINFPQQEKDEYSHEFEVWINTKG